MLILVSDLCFVSTVFVGHVTYTLMSAIIQGHLVGRHISFSIKMMFSFYLVRSLGSVFVTFFLHVEDSSLVIVVYGVGILVQPRLVRVLWRGRGVVWQYGCLQ